MDTIVKIYGPGKENYLVVGNGTDDLEFAQNAGVDFIYMKRPHRLKKLPSDAFEGKVIGNLFDLNQLLLKK
jgi:phosphoglycolate phosphatase-like HAD superfamily hydrolase